MTTTTTTTTTAYTPISTELALPSGYTLAQSLGPIVVLWDGAPEPVASVAGDVRSAVRAAWNHDITRWRSICLAAGRRLLREGATPEAQAIMACLLDRWSRDATIGALGSALSGALQAGPVNPELLAAVATVCRALQVSALPLAGAGGEMAESLAHRLLGLWGHRRPDYDYPEEPSLAEAVELALDRQRRELRGLPAAPRRRRVPLD